MKRNENIAPLSRDHHFGLLFCWKIRQGIKLNISPDRIRNYIMYYSDHHLLKHFEEEETILFIPGDPYCGKAKEDHDRIIQMITGIRKDTDPTQLQELADLVDRHIRYEERELFPYLERVLNAEQLLLIGNQLKQLHPETPSDTYKDEFWISKQP